MKTTKTEAWTLLDKRANYILQKTIRMQMEAWTLIDEKVNYTLHKTIKM